MNAQPGRTDGTEGRLVYLVENLASLHAAQNMPWIASRFEFLGEKAIGAALTVLALPDESGAYRPTPSASPRTAVARDLWEQLEVEGLPANTTAAALFDETERRGRSATYDVSEVFPGCAHPGAERAVVAPIGFNRETMGVGIFIVEPDDLTEALATMLAGHAAVAIQQLHERDEARRLHSVDPRLWVPDENFLVAQLRREVARARRYGREVGLALLRFESESAVREKYGDFYAGHVLRRIGSQLLMDVRDSDVVGALDGAYAVIHAETSVDGTQVSSERLRDKVLRMIAQRFPELTTPEISVRVASYPASANSVEDLLDRVAQPPAAPAADAAA